MLARLLKSTVAGVSALALTVAPVAAPAGASPALNRADYEACQARADDAFRAAIEAITLRSLRQGLARIDYGAAVRQEWRRLGIDEILDQRVDAAVGEVREESSWGQLLQSLAYQEKANELATAVAERVYRSEAMKTAFESLAVGIGKEVGKTIELATLDAAEPSVQCLQAFLGPRFGSTVARVVATDAGREFGIDPAKGVAQVSKGTVLLQGSEGIAGAVVLLVRRQLSAMATRIGHRLVGAVLGRIVSVVAGGIGVVLVAKDLWEFRNGVLPIIAEEMKSPETKQRVQQELASTIAEQLADHAREIASSTAGRVMEIWQDFRRAHAKVLDLAEQSPPFRTFLDRSKPEQLPRLDEVVGLLVAREGDAGVLKRLDDGTLHTAVNGLDRHGMDIARETQSLDAALAWTSLAGERLPLVVEYELHKRAAPGDFSKATLQRLLALPDRLATVRLASIGRESRDVLFGLDDARLGRMARALSEAELESLARYRSALPESAGARVLDAVAREPAKMQLLAPARVREAVIASRDPGAAIAMLLRADSLLPTWMAAPAEFPGDLGIVLEGRVSPILLWEKYPVLIGMAGLVLLLALLLLRRLLFGRRRRAAA